MAAAQATFAVNVTLVGGPAVVLEPVGDLDLLNAPALADAVDAAVDASASEVTIDLRRVSFMDSSGIRALVAVYRRSRRAGFSLAFLPGPPAVQRVLEMTGLAGILGARPRT